MSLCSACPGADIQVRSRSTPLNNSGEECLQLEGSVRDDCGGTTVAFKEGKQESGKGEEEGGIRGRCNVQKRDRVDKVPKGVWDPRTDTV